jgi:hypothetical protein
MSTYVRVLLLVYYLLYSVIYMGFLLHRSISPVIFQYLPRYIALLVVLAIPFVVALYIKSIGWKGLIYSLLPVFALLVITYLGCSTHYSLKQEHLFDKQAISNRSHSFSETSGSSWLLFAQIGQNCFW